jgi:hypothetical protein
VSIFRRGRAERSARHGRSGESRAGDAPLDSFEEAESPEGTGAARRGAGPDEPRPELAHGAEGAGGSDIAGAADHADSASGAERHDATEAAAQGPLDRSQVHSLNGRLDLGSLWITGVPGMELRLEIDEDSSQVVGATAVIAESALQLQAFAAPRTSGIWDSVRDELAQSIATSGGTAEESEGPLGTELRTRVPSAGPESGTVLAPARFMGVDGPRWFLRAVLTGRAAIEDAAAEPLLEVLRRVVVVRGQEPMAPREILPLTLPEQLRPTIPEPTGAATLAPFERGPEITEVR